MSVNKIRKSEHGKHQNGLEWLLQLVTVVLSFVYYMMNSIDIYRIALTIFYYCVVHFWIV